MNRSRPASIVVASAVTVIMSTAIAGVALWDLIVGDATGPRLGTNAYYIVVALLLVPASLALLAGRAWSRGVLITAHLLVLLSMIGLAQLLTWFAALTAGLSLLVLGALASPAARAHIADRRLPGD